MVCLGFIHAGLALSTPGALLFLSSVHAVVKSVDELLLETSPVKTPPLIDTVRLLRLQCVLGPPLSPV